MGIVHFVLWLIGSAVCFAQLPTVSGENCYTSAPLLWWPLMVTTILFGWAHILYYVYVLLGMVILLFASLIYLVRSHIGAPLTLDTRPHLWLACATALWGAPPTHSPTGEAHR